MIDYSAKFAQIKLTEKEYQLLSILIDILRENRSELVRRLLIQEAKRATAYLDGDEVDLWLSLIKQIEQERDLMQFQKGEQISEGMRKKFEEKTGLSWDVYYERKQDELNDYQRNYQRKRRLKIKMKELEELKKKWSEDA